MMADKFIHVHRSPLVHPATRVSLNRIQFYEVHPTHGTLIYLEAPSTVLHVSEGLEEIDKMVEGHE